jgi:hypothetical protein
MLGSGLQAEERTASEEEVAFNRTEDWSRRTPASHRKTDQSPHDRFLRAGPR